MGRDRWIKDGWMGWDGMNERMGWDGMEWDGMDGWLDEGMDRWGEGA